MSADLTEQFYQATGVHRIQIGQILSALSAAGLVVVQGWQSIETAPRDGTPVDLWVNGRREPDCRWGKPSHCCGEAGQYCDSDWHREKPGWVGCDDMILEAQPTLWRPLPAPPGDAACAR